MEKFNVEIPNVGKAIFEDSTSASNFVTPFIKDGYPVIVNGLTLTLENSRYGWEIIVKGTDVSIALLTGREKGKKRELILEKLAMGEIDILIGTHAVFTQDVSFKKLGLVVIDEQHKFGVQQRLALTKKQKGDFRKNKMQHFLARKDRLW